MKSYNGNIGFKPRINFGHLNCRMVLLGPNGEATDKLEEVTSFTQLHNLHVLGVSEAALHGPNSRVYRQCPSTESAIKKHLYIPGYTILLPETWRVHSQIRLLIYIKESVSFKVVKLPTNLPDLPLLTL